MVGYSAGGHLASLIGVAAALGTLDSDCALGTTEAPQAVVSAAGVQDLAELAWAGQVSDFVGGGLHEMPEAYREASPINHVAAGAPPFLFVHGDQDVYVPMHQSERMRDALRDVGTRADLLAISGGGHTMNPGSTGARIDWPEESIDAPEAWWAIREFLRDTVGRPP